MSLHDWNGRRVECRPYLVNLSFDGAPAVLQIRVFVDGDKVVGVRSMRLLEPDGPPVKSFDMGSYTEDVEQGAPTGRLK